MKCFFVQDIVYYVCACAFEFALFVGDLGEGESVIGIVSKVKTGLFSSL